MAPEKTFLPVTAYTARHRIEGEIVLLKGEHLSDKLNLTERQFESLHRARVFAADGGQLVHEAEALALNKNQITLMLPTGEAHP